MLKIKIRLTNKDNFTGRFYFYKNLITISIGKNIKFPIYSWYKKVKLNNFKEVLYFILAHELTHYVQKILKLPYNENIADEVGKEVVYMKRCYVYGGGGAKGGGGSRVSKSRGKTSKSKKRR